MSELIAERDQEGCDAGATGAAAGQVGLFSKIILVLASEYMLVTCQ